LSTSRLSACVLIGAVASLVLSGCNKSTNHPVTFGSPAGSAPPLLGPPASSSPPVASSSAAPLPSASAAASVPAGPPPTARLAGIVLQPTDLSAVWVPSAYVPDPNDAADNAALARCVGGRDTYADETSDSHSPDYTQGNATISSDASSYKTAADVTGDVAIIKSPKISSCYETLARTELLASLPAGSIINTESVTITAGTGGGPSNVIGTGTGQFNVTVNGALNDLFINVAFITGPLTEAEIDFANVGSPVPASIQAPLIAKIAARAAAVPSA
jgi:hypothetical protein